MGESIGFLLLFQVLLLALNAIFASAEIAMLSVNETKLENMAENGNKKAKRLRKLTREPANFLATIQIAITLSGFLGSAFAADNFSEPLVDWVIGLGVILPRAVLDKIAVVLITLILSYFTLIFGELVPKRIAMKKSEQIALGISGLVSGVAFIFRPVVWLLSASTNIVLRMFGIDPTETEDDTSEEEIRMMVDAGGKKGTIDRQEQEFIQNVFEFNDIIAGDIATHRTDVVVLWLEDDDATWDRIIHENRHTRYPVCDGSPDNIVGVLNAKDYFRLSDKSRANVLNSAMYPAYFVPETIKADVLFRNMKKTHNSLAIVTDEYGGMAGIITIRDLIEELVGEFNDEPEDLNNPEPHIEKINDTTWNIIGNVQLDELEEATGLELSSDDYTTFTGLVFDALGVIPNDGEQNIELELPEMTVYIKHILAHQVDAATIVLKPENKPVAG